MKRRKPYIIIAAIIVLSTMWAIFYPPLFVQFLEDKTFDFRFLIRGARPVGEHIVIVAIDEPSLARIGRWPWPRKEMAKLVHAIAAAKPSTIGIDILFSEPENDPQHTVVQSILNQYRQQHPDDPFVHYLQQISNASSGDQQLARAIQQAGNVILPFALDVVSQNHPTNAFSIPENIFFYPFMVVKETPFERPTLATGALLPIEPLEESAWSLGSAYTQYDQDGAIRWELLSTKLKEYFFPSFGLEIARHDLNLKREDVQLVVGEGILMGAQKISTDASGRVLINYAGPSQTFPTYSAAAVMHGEIPPATFKDKIVLIGTTALGTSDIHITPYAQMPGIEKQASVVENILHNNFLVREELVKIFNAALVFLCCIIALIYLPRLHASAGALFTALFIFAYLSVTQYLFTHQHLWIDIVAPTTAIFLLYTSITAYRFFTEERRARKIKAMFSSYTTEKVVDELLQHPQLAELGGVHRQVTVLFSDVRSFTTFSESRSPEEVVSILNEFLSAMTEVILAWDGTLDKFVGDEIMAFWGAPAAQKEHVALAFCCSLSMMNRMTEMKSDWLARDMKPFQIGIGLNSGDVVVGNIGCAGKKMDYTIIGDTVNLGARVEALTRNYHNFVMITEFTFQQLTPFLTTNADGTYAITMPQGKFDAIHIKPLEAVKVKGKDHAVMVYEVALQHWGTPDN